VLQPGPGNDKIEEYQNYNIATNLTVIFDYHEYICFGNPLYLTTMDSIISLVGLLLFLLEVTFRLKQLLEETKEHTNGLILLESGRWLLQIALNI
jgi:hypothetical protein